MLDLGTVREAFSPHVHFNVETNFHLHVSGVSIIISCMSEDICFHFALCGGGHTAAWMYTYSLSHLNCHLKCHLKCHLNHGLDETKGGRKTLIDSTNFLSSPTLFFVVHIRY